jgi:PhzF family phenazine biosynthesis protein
MSMSGNAPVEVLRYAAFTDTPDGGNPAGVVLDARGLDDPAMLAIAADVGYSETAFLTPAQGSDGHVTIRYFSPEAEVPFCGHATIATAVALAERQSPGTVVLDTRSGPVEVITTGDRVGRITATLTSVTPRVEDVEPSDLAEALAALRWSERDLDSTLPPRIGFAGASHLVIGTDSRQRLRELNYDFPRLRALMERKNWTTVHLVHRDGPESFSARDPFPPGGVVEDPATGAAAAAFGAYLRALGIVDPPVRVTIRQGVDMGRRSLLLVDIPADPAAGIGVTGTAVPIP